MNDRYFEKNPAKNFLEKISYFLTEKSDKGFLAFFKTFHFTPESNLNINRQFTGSPLLFAPHKDKK